MIHNDLISNMCGVTPLFYYKDSNWKLLKKALLLEDANACLDRNANQCMKVLWITFLK